MAPSRSSSTHLDVVGEGFWVIGDGWKSPKLGFHHQSPITYHPLRHGDVEADGERLEEALAWQSGLVAVFDFLENDVDGDAVQLEALEPAGASDRHSFMARFAGPIVDFIAALAVGPPTGDAE